MAIIKNHALDRRFDIEPRILQADFEIVKERQMEFDTETDPDTLYELFGEDAENFTEGPVWVYVLERRRAVEVWNTLMGDRDPEIARADAPSSLRALYGLSLQQNGIMGSPDTQTAEIQIASLFASSPIYPTQDLPEELSSPASSTQYPPSSLTSQIMETMQRNNSGAYPPSSVTTLSSPGTPRSRVDSTGKPVFRARPVPSTTASPNITPRMTKAAALRAGVDFEVTARGPRVAPTREEQKQAFMDVPGHKRSSTIQVASTAAPAIAPRMTKAAALRQGIQLPPKMVRAVSASGAGSRSSDVFEGVPGHKRRESISVLSTRPPAVAPRPNKSAALRAEKDKAPPTSFQFRSPVARTPSRTSSIGSRPSSAQSVRAPAPVTPMKRVPSAPAAGPSSAPPSMRRVPSEPVPSSSPVAAPPALKRRLSSLGAPAIAPRPNKSAQLRAAKMEAANALAQKTPPRTRPLFT